MFLDYAYMLIIYLEYLDKLFFYDMIQEQHPDLMIALTELH